MHTESRTSLSPSGLDFPGVDLPGLDFAGMMHTLPPAVASSLNGVLGSNTAGAPRQSRRLPERILVAAHQACDLGDLDVAAQLLKILELVIGQARGGVDPSRRRVMESLIAAHQRLWHLRHAEGVATELELVPAPPASGFHEGVEYPDFRPQGR